MKNEFTTALFGLLLMVTGIAGGCAGGEARPPAPAEVSGISVRDVEFSSGAGPIRGKVARVNLASPEVRVLVTAPLSSSGAGGPEAKLQGTDVWAKQMYDSLQAIDGATTVKRGPRALVAVNANFFSNVGGASNYKTGIDADILGLSISDGVVVSPPREVGGQGDPALVVRQDGSGVGLCARIARATDIDISGALEAVAGIGPSDTESALGTALLTRGFNTAHSARVAAQVRHPRTAVGVGNGGRLLVLVAIDGRQKDWSVGMTLPEVAKLLADEGCTDAVNLDGGGSTAFVFYDAEGKVMTNRPSDGKFRAVANSVGVVWESRKPGR